MQQTWARDEETFSVGLDEAELHRFGERLGVGDSAEHPIQLLRRDRGGLLVGPRGRERDAEAEKIAEVVAALKRVEQLADVRERVAAVEQLPDHPQSRQVRVVVDADAPLSPRRRDEAAILVRAHVANRGTGFARQLVDAIVPHR